MEIKRNISLLPTIFMVIAIALSLSIISIAGSLTTIDSSEANAETYKLLIIAPQEFESVLTSLKNFKDATSRPTLLTTLEDIYATSFAGNDTAEQVKNYIVFCEQTYGIDYVMLVGDSDKLPVRYVYNKDINDETDEVLGWRYIASDWYYSDLYYEGTGEICDWDSNENGFYGEFLVKLPNPWVPGRNDVLDYLDYRPDVAVGRVPASTVEEVQNYIDKVIQYESSCSEDKAFWFKRFLSVSGMGSGMWNADDEISQLNEISDLMSSVDFQPVKLYDEDYCYNNGIFYDAEPTTENINFYLNKGMGFMNVHCHGNRGNWCGEYIVDPDNAINHMFDLNNGERLPIIYSMPCFSGAFAPIPSKEEADRGEPYINESGTITHLTSAELPDSNSPISMDSWIELPKINPMQSEETDPESLTEYFLVKYPSKGAIAHIANTSVGFGQSMAINDGFFDGYVNFGYKTLGDIFNHAVTYGYDYHYNQDYSPGGLSAPDHTGMVRVNLFGDPSLAVGGWDAPPEVEISSPQLPAALQDGVTFTAITHDPCGVSGVYFYLREQGGTDGIQIGYEDLPGALNSSGKWVYIFDTTLLPDGYYVLLAKAIDENGNEGWSELVHFSIRNWAVIKLLPASTTYRAGRTIPVKFSLRIAAAVDPAQPFVYNEELEIRIYDTSAPGTHLQVSLYGDTSTDYRINTDTELYITNFKTDKKSAEYSVEIWRTSNNFLIDSFTFETSRK